MSSRTWVKINCDKWFDGTIRQESIEVRALWTDILALAGRTGQDGIIRLPGTTIGYSDDQLCAIFNTNIDVWLRVKERLSNHPSGAHENRIRVTPGNCIEIINWKHYQSEYVRQKCYRKKLQPKVTTESYSQKCGEKEIEKEIENIRSKTIYTDGFKSFWEVYPKLVGKQVAFEGWKRLLRAGYPEADIISAAKEYAKTREGKEDEFTLHPATFLNKGRWKDYCFEDETTKEGT